MIEKLFVSIECKCLMYQDDLDQFMYKKELPNLKLSINRFFSTFAFTKHNEICNLQLEAEIYHHQNNLCLSYINCKPDHFYGSVQILNVKFYGCNIGDLIFKGVYHNWNNKESYDGHTFMSHPGEWNFSFKSPVTIYEERDMLYG